MQYEFTERKQDSETSTESSKKKKKQCWHCKKLIIVNTKTQMKLTKIPKFNKQRNETTFFHETDVAMLVSWCTDIAYRSNRLNVKLTKS